MPTKKPVRRKAAPKRRRLANPNAPCAPVRLGKSRYNAYVGATIEYRGNTYEIVGCGVGSSASKKAGALTEGTYAMRNLQTGKMRYVPKRRVRDEAYHRGGRAILGMAGEGHRRKAKAAPEPGRNRKGQFVKKGR